jgi:hypothetical protein
MGGEEGKEGASREPDKPSAAEGRKQPGIVWGGRPRPPGVSKNHVATAAFGRPAEQSVFRAGPPCDIIPTNFMESPIDQSRRLQERYASLTDDELEAVTNDAFDLTDGAQQALQEEIARRGLHTPLTAAPGKDDGVEEEA